MLVYLNGSYLPKAQATISVEDRGFIFGDGIYEVWRVVEGRLFEAERHQTRLERGLGELRIAPPPEADSEAVLEIAGRLLAENELASGEATFYVEITRGAAPRTHQFPDASTRPTVFAMANRFVVPEAERARGSKGVVVPDIRWHRCDIKTVQLLPNVMAKQQAMEQGGLEAVLVRDGIVTEGAHSNLFGVLDGVLRTHPAGPHILPGITRDVVLELAHAAGLPAREEALHADDLPRLDELFLTGTTTDVTPLVRVDDMTIGTGAPGPVARRLYADLRARMSAATASVAAAASAR